MQMIYRILSAYFEDDCSDELTLDPVFNAILEKDRLASQPTLSRFLTVWMRIPSCSLMTLTNVSGTSSILSSVRSICFWTWTALCLALSVFRKGKASTSIIRHTDIIRYCAMMDWLEICSKQNFVMEHSTVAVAKMQINLWSPSFWNTWKEGLKLIFVETADFHLPGFIKSVRWMAVPMPSV